MPDQSPPKLAYDDLPPGSDIVREYSDDGSVTIKVPAAEPPRAALRALSQQAVIFAAIVSAALIIGAIIIIGSAIILPAMPTALRVWAIVWFGVFCIALLILLWRLRFAEMEQRLHRMRRQSTILHASRGRLIIETTGPFGAASHDLRSSDIASITIDPGRRLARLAAIDLRLSSGESLRLLRGRDAVELKWIMGLVRETMDSAINTSNNVPNPGLDAPQKIHRSE